MVNNTYILKKILNNVEAEYDADNAVKGLAALPVAIVHHDKIFCIEGFRVLIFHDKAHECNIRRLVLFTGDEMIPDQLIQENKKQNKNQQVNKDKA